MNLKRGSWNYSIIHHSVSMSQIVHISHGGEVKGTKQKAESELTGGNEQYERGTARSEYPGILV